MTSRATYICGIDAGASKTQCAICSADGVVLANVLTGPAAVRGLEEHFAQPIVAAVRRACEQAAVSEKDLGIVVAGLAGVDTTAGQQRALEAMKMAMPRVPIVVENDAAVALEAAMFYRPGAILMAGTGSIGYGENAQGNTHRVGGWGHIFGDEGSAYNIAVQALAAALQASEGRGDKTSLGDRACEYFELKDIQEIIDLTDTVAFDPSFAAAFAPSVFAAEREGDVVAAAIAARASDHLTKAALHLIARLQPAKGLILALGGGLLLREESYARRVKEQIASAARDVRVVRSVLPPVAGALLKGLASFGKSLDHQANRKALANALIGTTEISVY
jgi:N-acetylglucosamine kinase-like BadF-type ATPase